MWKNPQTALFCKTKTKNHPSTKKMDKYIVINTLWYVCIYMYMYVYIYIHIYTHTQTHRHTHTHTHTHTANGKSVRNRGRLIIQVGIGPGYWSSDSLFPSFFSSPFCHLSSTIRWVGGLLAGCWLANRNSLGASVLGVCSLKDEPEQQRMIFLSTFSQFKYKESRWGDVIRKRL